MKKRYYIIFAIFIILLPLLIILFSEIFPAGVHDQTYDGFSLDFLGHGKLGLLWRDTVFSGEIYIPKLLIIPFWVDLKIKPGTIIKFKNLESYKDKSFGGLLVFGGTIKAKGTNKDMIWFTSKSKSPINGDWLGIHIENSDSEFDHVIVEFAETGIAQFDSEVSISNSIIRWSNAEGLYAERSKPVFENNTLYGNGYHEIALEQYNDVKILNNIIRDGHFAIHTEKTTSLVEGNCIFNEMGAVSAGMESKITVKNNYFSNIGPNLDFNIYDNSIINSDYKEVNYFDGLQCPEFDYEDVKNFDLGYIPGDLQDRYPYVYAERDETRRVVKKIGKDLHFGWALEYVDGYLYRFTLGEVEFVKINPETEEYTFLGNEGIMNPRGLVYDGEYFYVNDFSLLKIFKFTIENDHLKVVDSFDIPEKEKGGTMGLATDGDFLYLRDRDGSKLYKLDKSGKVLGEIKFSNIIHQAIVFTGEYFWAYSDCGKGICKFTKDGKLVGEIYQAAKDTWALAYDGEYLWTIQRTCEMWNDPKIYQIEILDDSLG